MSEKQIINNIEITKRIIEKTKNKIEKKQWEKLCNYYKEKLIA